MQKVNLFVVMLLLLVPEQAHAVLPPDLLFSIGSSFVQIFSVLAVVVGGLFSSFIYFARRGLMISIQHVWVSVGIIISIVLMAITAAYLVDLKNQNKLIKNELNNIQSENGDLINTSATSSDSNLTFYGDSIILYSNNDANLFVLSLDMNRKGVNTHNFTHYTFLDGLLSGEIISDYSQVYGRSPDLRTNDFVTSIKRVSAPDTSPRDTYEISLEIEGDIMEIEVIGLEGDFITRNQSTYTQYQSVGNAVVSFQGKTFNTHVLVEGLSSSDYTKQIFFEGFESVDSVTHQFVLWDEDKNFYLIDESVVTSDTPEYPSHTWLLKKEYDSSKTQKSFSAKIDIIESESNQKSWRVSIPDFDDAVIELKSVDIFKETSRGRTGFVVEGTIVDTDGQRSISGILHLAK